ncbi:MAG TPA: polyprenyl synthetase family protein [Firmicutes bacterium]|nr:polyprenyl synthetase family protein [Bacillota bacterium]
MIEEKISRFRDFIDDTLDKIMPGEDHGPSCTLHKAMRYAMFPGGKRLRPIFTLLTAEALGLPYHKAIRPACAIELIHSYSLIHDDLPCMDDDDERRGRPTVHRVFGSPMALLAGDALLSLAFEVITAREAVELLGYCACTQIANELAFACGSLGMVGGQGMEVDTWRSTDHAAKSGYDSDWVISLARHKTGALFIAAVRSGAIAAEAGEKELMAVTSFAEKVGLAFQIVDDVLDGQQDRVKSLSRSCWASEDLRAKRNAGVRVGTSFLDYMSAKDALARVDELTKEGLDDLEILGPPAAPLAELAQILVKRSS